MVGILNNFLEKVLGEVDVYERFESISKDLKTVEIEELCKTETIYYSPLPYGLDTCLRLQVQSTCISSLLPSSLIRDMP